MTTEEYKRMLDNDENYSFRVTSAQQGYNLDKLANDKDCRVRLAVVKQNYNLNKFVNDKCWWVRELAKRKIRKQKDNERCNLPC